MPAVSILRPGGAARHGSSFSLGDFARMERETHIRSYFSLPTDLAGEMRSWPEFVSGQDYGVELKHSDTGEVVVVKYVDDGEERYVSVSSPEAGSLFYRVLGRVVYALSEHSDDLMVDKWR
jgi:hypothetical protein